MNPGRSRTARAVEPAAGPRSLAAAQRPHDPADAQAAAAALGQKLIVLKAGSEGDIDAAFAAMSKQRVSGLLQHLDPFLLGARAHDLGVKQVIPKPFRRDELLDAVSGLIGPPS